MAWSPGQDAALQAVTAWLKRGDRQVFRMFGYAGTGKTTLAKQIADDMSGDVIFGAFIDGELRGAGELRPLAPDQATAPFLVGPSKAEAAFSVERSYRRRGLGVQLFERLMRAAAAHRMDEEVGDLDALQGGPEGVGIRGISRFWIRPAGAGTSCSTSMTSTAG